MSSALPPLPEPDTHCFDDDTQRDVWSHSSDQMRAYGEACAAAEREACAKVCDEQALSDENCKCPLAVSGWWPDQVTYRCAEAIRARGET